MIYHPYQLTGSNGHVVGIDSPVPSSPPVASPNRFEDWIQELVAGGLPAIEMAEAKIRARRITCCMDIDAKIIHLGVCKEARERLAQQSENCK